MESCCGISTTHTNRHTKQNMLAKDVLLGIIVDFRASLRKNIPSIAYETAARETNDGLKHA